MKKIVSIGLMILMIVFSTVPTYASNTTADTRAAEGSIHPDFISMSSISAGLSISSSGKSTCTGSVTPSSSSYTSKLTVGLQKSTGSGWSTVKTWTASGRGSAGADLVSYYYVGSGTYRVSSTAKIYNASGTLLETQTAYSSTKTY
jgi:hypothetical protein